VYADRNWLTMNRESFLNPDALRHVLLAEQLQLPLTHSQALHLIARLHGYRNWNASAAGNLNQAGLKQRAKALRAALGSGPEITALTAEQIAAIIAALNAVPLTELVAVERPAVLNELTAQDADMLGYLGAGASSAELELLMGTRDLGYPLIMLSSALQIHSDPERDAFARQHGLVQPRHREALARLRVRRPPLVTAPTALNLAAGVNFEAFRDLIAAQNDDAGHHSLWVDRDGAIHLDIVPKHLSPAMYEGEIDNRMQFRYETFEQGLGYMGPGAAEDARFVEDLLHGLQRDWNARAAGYIETY